MGESALSPVPCSLLRSPEGLRSFCRTGLSKSKNKIHTELPLAPCSSPSGVTLVEIRSGTRDGPQQLLILHRQRKLKEETVGGIVVILA